MGIGFAILRATERIDYGLLLKLVEILFPDPDDRRKLLWERHAACSDSAVRRRRLGRPFFPRPIPYADSGRLPPLTAPHIEAAAADAK